jgi:Holliday junction resolvasome RuvABC endonuclease subunit
MKHGNDKDLVLGLYPTARGFAFALFEGPLSPLDWGNVDIKKRQDKNAVCLERVDRLVERYHPDVVVLERCGVRGSRRSQRIHRLYRAIAAFAHTQGIEVEHFARSDIRARFAPLGAVTKHEIARAIAKNIPAFEHRLPPLRKPWMSEDLRMGLFDATSLVFAHYLTQAGQRQPD